MTHSIAERLRNILEQGGINPHVNIYIQDQILLQVVPARDFEQHGLKIEPPDSLAIIHCFNKNKTLTFDKLDDFRDSELSNQYLYFEEPKGYHNYVACVGANPQEIQDKIYECLKNVYLLENTGSIEIEYTVY